MEKEISPATLTPMPVNNPSKDSQATEPSGNQMSTNDRDRKKNKRVPRKQIDRTDNTNYSSETLKVVEPAIVAPRRDKELMKSLNSQDQ